jgi:hypothetical protein
MDDKQIKLNKIKSRLLETKSDIEKSETDYFDFHFCLSLEEINILLDVLETTHNSNYTKCPKCKGDTYISLCCLKCDHSESIQ